MKKQVYLIHGWGGNPNNAWFPWLRQELIARGYEVVIPQMPNTENPTIEEWVPFLAKIASNVNEQTYFIGHSIGCQTIMRHFEVINRKIGGMVFVAGWFVLEDLNEEEMMLATPWTETPIDFEKIKVTTKNISLIISDNDPWGGFEENKKIFSEKLGAKIIVEKGLGHFSEDESVFKLPSVLKEIIRFSK